MWLKRRKSGTGGNANKEREGKKCGGRESGLNTGRLRKGEILLEEK